MNRCHPHVYCYDYRDVQKLLYTFVLTVNQAEKSAGGKYPYGSTQHASKWLRVKFDAIEAMWSGVTLIFVVIPQRCFFIILE